MSKNLSLNYSLAEINEAAKVFWQEAKAYRIFAFRGDLGAGKTTFVAALAQVMGIEDSVSSPTFSLINEYHFFDKDGNEKILFHSDCYRLKDIEEAIQAGIEDMLEQKNAYCIIEWPERILPLLPEDALWVDFKLLDDGGRQLLCSFPG